MKHPWHVLPIQEIAPLTAAKHINNSFIICLYCKGCLQTRITKLIWFCVPEIFYMQDLCMCHIKLHYKNDICSTLFNVITLAPCFVIQSNCPYVFMHVSTSFDTAFIKRSERATPSTQQCKSNMAVQECPVYQSSINHLFTHLVSLFATRSDFLDQRVEWFFFSGFSGCIAGCTSQQAMLL